MYKIITLSFLILTSVSVAQKKKKPRWSDTYKVKPTPKIEYSEIAPFIKGNQYLVTSVAGDFNGDKQLDAIVILADKKEDEEILKQEKPIKRPLLILKRNKNGVLEKMHENDKVVYCYMCGSTMGSPLTSVLFDGNVFAVQHEAGKSNRWSRIISFEYDKEKEVWLLLKDATSRYNIMNSKGLESTVKTQNDFGFITFEKFDAFEEDLIKKTAN